MVDECSPYSKMTVFETLDSERRRKWRHDVTSIVLFDNWLQMPGGRDTINCQMSAPRDSSYIRCPGFARGEDARDWNWLTH